MTFSPVYAIVAGIAMLGYWSVSLARSKVPELETEPIRIGFHIVAEFATAIVLLVGGIGLLLSSSWGLNVYLVAMGMLLYTVVVSPGYFAQKREWRMVGLFVILIVLGVASLVLAL